MRGAGAVSDYSLDRIRKMRADVAVAAGVLVSDVAIAVSAGSVLIDVTIIVASSATASVVSSTITRKLTSASTYVTSPLITPPAPSLPAPPCLPLTLSHPDLTSWHSASAIFTSAVVSIEAVVAQPQTTEPTPAGGLGTAAIVGIAAGGGVVGLLVLALMYARCCRESGSSANMPAAPRASGKRSFAGNAA